MRASKKPTDVTKAEFIVMPVVAARDAVYFPGLPSTLHVVRETSLNALRKGVERDRLVLLVSQRDMSQEDPSVDDLFEIGTISEVLQTIPLPDASLRVALRGIHRGRVLKSYLKNGSFWADVSICEEAVANALETEALMRATIDAFTKVVQLNHGIPPEALQGISQIELPGLLADTIAHHLPVRSQEKQVILETLDVVIRLEAVLSLLKKEEQVQLVSRKVHERVERELGDSQREYYLREQLKAIQDELRGREDRVGETDEYRERISASGMPEVAAVKALAEVRRLERTPASTPEGLVIRTYLDTVLTLPWSVTSEDRLDVKSASQLLDENHFGLAEVKDRILDFLAVRQLKGSLRGPILCFLGPPGVGKTSIGRSIAEAMGRQFVRISLGGERDEAEIRGHRRTYVGSMPGRLIQGIRDAKTRNPVIVLDEIDKMGGGATGDPTSALLEALDPEQNRQFVDHYIEVPFDMSATMFIATANVIEKIPPALRDRMEFIYFPGYTDRERLEIGLTFLLGRACEDNGLRSNQIEFRESTMQLIVSEYTREAGVRGLERAIQAVCRKAARLVAEGKQSMVSVGEEQLRSFLGRPRYLRRTSQKDDAIGEAWSMVVSEVGGELLKLESTLIPRPSNKSLLTLTGNLGDILQESAQTALTCVRAQIESWGEVKTPDADVHIHMPDGATPKDGPSAGVTIAVALASAYLGRPIKGSFAFTGEITLRGRVFGVGGVREKVLAAIRGGLTDVVLPEENRPDAEDVPKDVADQIRLHFVSTLDEALNLALI